MNRVLRVLAAIVARLPWRTLPKLGALLAFLAFDVLRIRRRHAIASLERSGLGDVETARQAYRSLGTGIFELLWMSARPDALDVRIENEALFDRACAFGRGVIIATAHTGNWDLAACACARRSRLSVVTKRLSSRGFDLFWQDTRRARGVDLLAAPDGQVMSRVRARLAEGGSVALLVDQDPERTTSVVAADFLGEAAVHDTFAATLSARTGAPILVAFARREGHRHVLELVELLEAGSGRVWIAETTRAIAARLEAFVRAHPDQWLWLHRRWKTRPTHAAVYARSPSS